MEAAFFAGIFVTCIVLAIATKKSKKVRTFIYDYFIKSNDGENK